MVNTQFDVFISYSTENNNIAHRIYYDLVRSGLKVWLYEIDGQIANNFRREIFEKLKIVNHFCLIDSQFARKSAYVEEECEFFWNQIKDENLTKRKFIVCQIEKNGDWRDKEFFEKQNEIKYIDFFNYGKRDEKGTLDSLDFKERYQNGIQQLCKALGVEFQSWSNLPSWIDFEKEVVATNLSRENQEILIADYKNFIKTYKPNSEDSESRIRLINSECRELGVRIITTSLALGEIQVNTNRKRDANLIFKQVTEEFSDDPRGWVALGTSEFYFNNYAIAFDCFDKAAYIISKTKDNPYNQEHFGEVLHNKIKVLIALNDLERAKSLVNNLEADYRDLPEIQIADINLLLKYEDIKNAEELYNKLIKKVYTNAELNSTNLRYALAELERNFSEFYSGLGLIKNAITHLEYALKMDPEEIRYFAELSLLYFCDKKNIEGNNLIQEGLKIKPKEDSDYYFYGQLLFFNRDERGAKENYLKSNTKWPYYNHLITIMA